jgi:hypothetical protein
MFECFVFSCFLGAAPAPVVPDGAGGYVPFTNSRVLPDGQLRPYDPAIDGPVPVYPMPGYAEPAGSYLPPPEAGMWLRPYPHHY